MIMNAFQVATLLTLAITEPTTDEGIRAHNDALNFFESYEETCLGWDGADALASAERLGICYYFEIN